MKLGTYESLFGKVTIATTDGLLCGVTFGSPEPLISYLRKYKVYQLDDELPPTNVTDNVLDIINNGVDPKIHIYLYGTPFQIKVWNELLHIPKGTLLSYQHIADRIRKPKATRAVANAIGCNPIAVIVPCHRVVRLDGSLGGYRWGMQIKRSLLQREEPFFKKTF